MLLDRLFTAHLYQSIWQNHALAGMIVYFAKFGLAISVFALLLGWLRARTRISPTFFIGGAILSVVVGFLAGHMSHDVRPFAVLKIAPLIPHESDNGFPSDHSIAAAYVAAYLAFVDAPAFVLAAISAVLIGLARVLVAIHWPGDIIGGWAIGIFAAILAVGAGSLRPKRATLH